MQVLSLTNGLSAGHGYFPVFMYFDKASFGASSGTKAFGYAAAFGLYSFAGLGHWCEVVLNMTPAGHDSHAFETMLKYGLSFGHKMQVLSLTNGLSAGQTSLPEFM
jgi:hypothetical protein